MKMFNVEHPDHLSSEDTQVEADCMLESTNGSIQFWKNGKTMFPDSPSDSPDALIDTFSQGHWERAYEMEEEKAE